MKNVRRTGRNKTYNNKKAVINRKLTRIAPWPATAPAAAAARGPAPRGARLRRAPGKAMPRGAASAWHVASAMRSRGTAEVAGDLRQGAMPCLRPVLLGFRVQGQLGATLLACHIPAVGRTEARGSRRV